MMWLALRRKVGKVCRGVRGDWHVRRVPRRDLMKEVMFEPSPDEMQRARLSGTVRGKSKCKALRQACV